MKLYIKEGNILKIDDTTFLELMNLDEFVNGVRKAKGHSVMTLKYKINVNGKEYLGEATADTYHGFSDKLDSSCPYNVKLHNWCLAEEEKQFIEFNITAK